MKKLAVIGIVLFMVSSCALGQIQEIKHPHAPNQIIVKLKTGFESMQVLEKLNNEYRVLEVTKLSGERTFLVKFPDGTKLEKALVDYQKNKHVEFAEPNYIYRLME